MATVACRSHCSQLRLVSKDDKKRAGIFTVYGREAIRMNDLIYNIEA